MIFHKYILGQTVYLPCITGETYSKGKIKHRTYRIQKYIVIAQNYFKRITLKGEEEHISYTLNSTGIYKENQIYAKKKEAIEYVKNIKGIVVDIIE